MLAEHDRLIAESEAILENSRCEEPILDRIHELAEAGQMESGEARELILRLDADECAK
ncbi:MAG: hypothetical protein NXI18_21720 [Alphaproteobacteria bacterium]|nr:hypothetical protein [Alphaproteobacteria bacterium]